MNLKPKFIQRSIIGEIMIFIGILVGAPLLVLPWYPTDIKYLGDFLIPCLFSVGLGILICLFSKTHLTEKTNWKHSMGRSSLTVIFAWVWGVIIGALPFIISGQLKVIPALFEAVSGWTTTGLSTMDVSKVDQIFLFHRSFMQYCGGLGFIMMMILFISNKCAMKLYNAEGHPDKIMPNIKKTTQAIFIIYNICLVLGTIAYRIAGMTWFDGICHSMCSLSTGGFSTKLNSIGEYNSLPIEIITIVLMIIGTTNFAALILLAKGQFKKFSRVSEVRFMLLLLAIFIPPTAISLASHLGVSFWHGLRIATFDIVSAMSTSGYSTMSYTEWSQFGIAVLILMMVIGGGIGSTAGGIKLSRVYIMLRLGITNMAKRLSPTRRVFSPHFKKADSDVTIDSEVIEDTVGFFICYLVVYVIGSLALTVTANCTLTEAMFDFASSLSTVGLSIGITNAATPNAALIVEMIGMFMGRLEIFIVVVGITFGFKALKEKLFPKRHKKAYNH